MVMSCLVEPLVAPLVGRGAGARPGRSALQRSRLSRTALLMTAVMAIGGTTSDDLLDAKASKTVRVTKSPHKKPAPIPLRDVAKVFGKVKTFIREDERFSLAKPSLAPRFEWDAVWASRLRHADDISGSGRALGRGRRADRVGRSRTLPFLCFGSGEYRSGPSSPVFA